MERTATKSETLAAYLFLGWGLLLAVAALSTGLRQFLESMFENLYDFFPREQTTGLRAMTTAMMVLEAFQLLSLSALMCRPGRLAQRCLSAASALALVISAVSFFAWARLAYSHSLFSALAPRLIRRFVVWSALTGLLWYIGWKHWREVQPAA